MELMYAEIPLIEHKECLRYASTLGRRPEYQVVPQRICAGYEYNRQFLQSVPCEVRPLPSPYFSRLEPQDEFYISSGYNNNGSDQSRPHYFLMGVCRRLEMKPATNF